MGKHRKVKAFSVAMEKQVTKIDEDGKESVVIISQKTIW